MEATDSEFSWLAFDSALAAEQMPEDQTESTGWPRARKAGAAWDSYSLAHVNHDGYTELQNKACKWFGKVCHCCSLTLLSGPAWVLLNMICND